MFKSRGIGSGAQCGLFHHLSCSLPRVQGSSQCSGGCCQAVWWGLGATRSRMSGAALEGGLGDQLFSKGRSGGAGGIPPWSCGQHGVKRRGSWWCRCFGRGVSQIEIWRSVLVATDLVPVVPWCGMGGSERKLRASVPATAMPVGVISLMGVSLWSLSPHQGSGRKPLPGALVSVVLTRSVVNLLGALSWSSGTCWSCLIGSVGSLLEAPSTLACSEHGYFLSFTHESLALLLVLVAF